MPVRPSCEGVGDGTSVSDSDTLVGVEVRVCVRLTDALVVRSLVTVGVPLIVSDGTSVEDAVALSDAETSRDRVTV